VFVDTASFPVICNSALMVVAYGANAKEAGLDLNLMRVAKLEKFTGSSRS
jgi:hypothetical protein